MMSQAKSVDNRIDDACDTGALILAGKNLRTYPINSEEEAPFCHKDLLELDISKNRFPELPALIYTCEALVKLNCYHNVIRAIPDSIHKLHNLKHIDLSRNFLTTFPNGLCWLQLHSLSVSNNRIDSIPAEIGRLKDLQSLDISNNLIEQIPPSIGELSGLKWLDLQSNKVEVFPEDICRLHITELNISDNLIQQLPTSIRKMSMLVELRVDGNPLAQPPPQVCSRGRVHIFKYLSRVEQGVEAPEKSLLMKGKSRRGNSHSTHSRRVRPMSNISTRSDEPSNRSFYDEVKNLVSSAFSSPYEPGDAARHQLHVGDISRYNGTLQSPDKQRKQLSSKQSANAPASPGTTRRVAHYSTLPRNLIKESRKPEIKQQHSPTTPVHVVNSHDDIDNTRNVISPPVISSNSSRKLPTESNARPGSWNSTHTASTTAKTIATTQSSASYSLSQTDVNTYTTDSRSSALSKSRSRSNAMTKEERHLEDSLAPMRKQNITSGSMDLPTSPSVSTPGMSSKAVSTDNSSLKVSLVKVGSSREITPDMEIRTPVSKHQPDNIQLEEVDSVLSSLHSDLVKEEIAMQESPRQSPLPKKSLSVVNTTSHLKKPAKSLSVVDTTSHFNKPMVLSPPHVSPNSSPILRRKQEGAHMRPEGSPSSIKKKSATFASVKDVELRMHSGSGTANLPHRQSLPPPNETDWIDKVFSSQKTGKPVFQQLVSEKQTDYTMRRQKRNIQAELEKIEDVKDSVETVLSISLKADVIGCFSDGVILCQLINQLFPRTIPSIMDTQPMNMVKRTKNVDAFLDACTKLGIKHMCTASDILDCKNPMRLCNCIQTLLMRGGHSTV